MSAFSFALGTVLLRKRIDESNFISVTLVTTTIGTMFFWMLVPITVPLNTIHLNGILFFVLAGAFVPGFGRLIYFRGMKSLGASRNASIVATSPLVSTLIAVFAMGEHPSLAIWIGMLITIGGIIAIVRSTTTKEETTTQVSRFAFVYPLISLSILGFGLVIRKIALNVYSEPVIGLAICYSTSLFVYVSISVFSRTFRDSTEMSKRTFQLFWKGGLCWCFGHMLGFYALAYSDVSITAPILNTEPFFILVLAPLFLKKLEKVTFLLVIGTMMALVGISFITVF
jgi:drug/metabolite transporter (DMT)-like permease